MDRYAEAKSMCRLFAENGYPTMMAGGCVRDRIFGLEPKDYDLATVALPEEALSLCRRQGYKVIPTGLKHGTISVVTKLQTLEFTTLRTDNDCDGRHANVSFSNDFSEDAQRRDFTINALFEDSEGEIHDFVGGQRDLKAKQLRFVGDPPSRIREDYLRILRYFRFLARFGWQPLPNELEAISANLDGLALLSVERVQSEMTQILASPGAAAVLPLLHECGLATKLYSWLDPSSLANLATLLGRTDNGALRWLSFYYWGSGARLQPSQLAEEVAKMRFTRKQVKLINSLAVLLAGHENLADLLLHALRFESRELIEPTTLLAYLQACREIFAFQLPDHLIRLLAGMNELEPPTVPRKALMQLEPTKRGQTVHLVKIYWYLKLAHVKTDFDVMMRHSETYQDQLKSGDPKPVT